MRITNSTLTTNYLRNLNRNLAAMQKLQNQLSSGKVVTRPSEDPLLVSKIMDLRNTISTNEQYNRTITDTIGWVDTQDGALQGAISTVQRIRELVIYGANGTLSNDDRNAIAEEVKVKVGELADVLNTNFDGRYIFSGTNTTDKPFTPDLVYQGNNNNINREISTGVEVELAVDGKEFTTIIKESVPIDVEQTLGVLLEEIITALENGDSEALSGELLGDLDKHLDNILSFRSKIGAISNRLEAAKERNEAENLNLNNLLSQREDIDLAQKYTEANILNSVYLASLSIGAKILQPSLLDYLRWITVEKIKIETKYLEELEVEYENILNFPNGILGFEHSTRFVLIDFPDNSLFKFLQDVDNVNVCFILINPWDFFEDYEIDIPDKELDTIDLNPEIENSLEVYSIVTLGNSLNESTANLLAPVIINIKAKIGKQYVLTYTSYSTKHKLITKGAGE